MKMVELRPGYFSDFEDYTEDYQDINLVQFAGQGYLPDAKKTILITENTTDVDTLELLAQKKCRSIIPKGNPFFQQEVLNVAKWLSENTLYFNDTVKTALGPHSNFIKIEFSSLDKKTKIHDGIELFLKKLPSRAAQDSVRAIASELVMNATYDAPQEALQQGLLKDSNGLLGLKSELLLAHDDHQVLVSVWDPYGSLQIDSILSQLIRVQIEGMGSVINLDTAEGGAGIGSSIVFQHSLSLVLGVERGKQTRVTSLFPIQTSQRKFAALKKNVHIITNEAA